MKRKPKTFNKKLESSSMAYEADIDQNEIDSEPNSKRSKLIDSFENQSEKKIKEDGNQSPGSISEDFSRELQIEDEIILIDKVLEESDFNSEVKGAQNDLSALRLLLRSLDDEKFCGLNGKFNFIQS
jgi:hypothetical protein